MKQKNRPRVLFVCPLPPPVHGSSVVSKQIKDSKIINDAFRCDYVNNSNSRSMNEIGKFPLAKIGRYFGAYFRMLCLLLVHRYDLVYLAITVNGIGFLKDWPFVFTARLLARHHVIHQHNKGMDGYVDKRPYGWMLRACYKRAKVILLSWRLYPDICRIVDKSNVLICPNGITTSKVQGCNRDQHTSDSPNDDRVFEILYLSNLIESKGVWVVLDACKIIKDKGYKFHCSFVGGVSKQINNDIFCQAVKWRDLEGYVEYVGPKYGDSKETYWQKADVFVFPTFYYNECFPLVVLEAMQHRVAVISTNEGAIPDILGNAECGFMVDANVLKQHSCNEMLGSHATEEEREKSRYFNATRGLQTAEVMEKLILSPDLCKKMGEAGYAKYQREFTLEAFENRMLDCLNECL